MEVTSDIELLTFKVNGETFAVNTLEVESIVNVNKITSVPNTKSYIDGIMSYRNGTVSVINLSKRMFNCDNDIKSEKTCIVCKVGNTKMALHVPEIAKIINLSSNDILPLDIIARSDKTIIKNVLQHDKKIVQIVDLDKLYKETTES